MGPTVYHGIPSTPWRVGTPGAGTGEGSGQQERVSQGIESHHLNPGRLGNLLPCVHLVAIGSNKFSEALELGFHKAGQVVDSKVLYRKLLALKKTTSLPQLPLALRLGLMKTPNSKIRI